MTPGERLDADTVSNKPDKLCSKYSDRTAATHVDLAVDCCGPVEEHFIDWPASAVCVDSAAGADVAPQQLASVSGRRAASNRCVRNPQHGSPQHPSPAAPASADASIVQHSEASASLRCRQTSQKQRIDKEEDSSQSSSSSRISVVGLDDRNCNKRKLSSRSKRLFGYSGSACTEQTEGDHKISCVSSEPKQFAQRSHYPARADCSLTEKVHGVLDAVGGLADTGGGVALVDPLYGWDKSHCSSGVTRLKRRLSRRRHYALSRSLDGAQAGDTALFSPSGNSLLSSDGNQSPDTPDSASEAVTSHTREHITRISLSQNIATETSRARDDDVDDAMSDGDAMPTSKQSGWERIDIDQEKGTMEANWSEKWSTFGPKSTDYVDEGTSACTCTGQCTDSQVGLLQESLYQLRLQIPKPST